MSRALWLLVGAAVFGCGGVDDAAPPVGAIPSTPPSGDVRPPVPRDPIEWHTCSLDPTTNDRKAECAEVDVPRDAAPSGRTIRIALKRIPSSRGHRGAVWLLHGGPGASGVADLEALAGSLPRLVPDLDFITLDHRGVGGSERLGCPAQEGLASEDGPIVSEAEWPACIRAVDERWGADLAAFSTTAAARDVGYLIALAKKTEGDRVFVWGGSYGAYLAQRYMFLFPEQPDGVILEGIAGPELDFAHYSEGMNDVGKAIFAKCALDPTCRAKLGPDPWATARDVVVSFDRGHCPALGIDGMQLRSMLGALLFSETLRGAVAPIVYRAKRCAPADVEALSFLTTNLFGGAGASPMTSIPRRGLGTLDDSSVLFYQIALAEFWRAPGVTVAAAKTELDGLVTATPLTFRIARIAETWPPYAQPDSFTGRLPAFDRPLLMLQGGLDPATPAKYTEPLRAKYNGAHQTYAFFPNGAHDPSSGTIGKSTGMSCGLDLYMRFLQKPAQDLDTSCIEDTEDVTFLGNKGDGAFFNADDPWENP